MKQRIKNRWLIVGFAIAMILAYKLSISKTLEARSEIKTIEETMLGFEDVGRLSANLKSKEVYLDSILTKNNLKNNSVENSLLDFLNNKSAKNSIKIVEFLEPHLSRVDEITSISYQFSLRGNYKDLEQILSELELQTGYGKISHVSFEKKKDYRRRLDYLLAKVIVENYNSK